MRIRNIMAACALIWCSAGVVLACTLPEMRTDVAPQIHSDTPISVNASVIIMDILEIDDLNQQINLDLGVTFSWEDGRLEGLAGCRFGRTQVWVPDVVLRNSSNLRMARTNQRDQVSIGPGGHVSYEQRLVGNVSSYHNLRRFPFDRHALEISFLAVDTPADALRFVPDTAKTWLSDRLNIEGWQIDAVALGESVVQLREAGYPLSLLTLTISAEREVNYYLFRILLPLFFVVAMSWVIFWVPPSRFEFQIGLGATSMLTVIAFNLAVAGALPPLGYLTVLDQILIWSIVMVFLAICEALYTGLSVVNGHEARAERVDRIARLVFPALLLGGWWIIATMGLQS